MRALYIIYKNLVIKKIKIQWRTYTLKLYAYLHTLYRILIRDYQRNMNSIKKLSILLFPFFFLCEIRKEERKRESLWSRLSLLQQISNLRLRWSLELLAWGMKGNIQFVVGKDCLFSFSIIQSLAHSVAPVTQSIVHE